MHVEEVWGTVVSLHLLGSDDAALAAARDEIVAFLHHVDEVFSAFREDSVLRRWHRGETQPTPELQEVLALAGTVAVLTHGAFDPKWNGDPDPTGVVKGWAVDRAVEKAAAHGVTDLVINAGGHVSTRGSAGNGGPWQFAVTHPDDPSKVVMTVLGHDLNVATSGSAEHIRCRSVRTAASATVIGPNLAVADGIATGAIAACDAAPDILRDLDEAGWLSQLVDLDGSVWRSPRLERLLSGG